MNDFALSEQDDRNNFQPRIGAVYDVSGNGKDIVRGGWGIYTDFGYTNSRRPVPLRQTPACNLASVRCSRRRSERHQDAERSVLDPRHAEALNYPHPEPGGRRQLTRSSVPVGGSAAADAVSDADQRRLVAYQLSDSTVISADYVNSLGRDLNYRLQLEHRFCFEQHAAAALVGPADAAQPELRVRSSGGQPGTEHIQRADHRPAPPPHEGVDSHDRLHALERRQHHRQRVGRAEHLERAERAESGQPLDPLQIGPNVTTRREGQPHQHERRHPAAAMRLQHRAVLHLPLGAAGQPH